MMGLTSAMSLLHRSKDWSSGELLLPHTSVHRVLSPISVYKNVRFNVLISFSIFKAFSCIDKP